MPIKIMRTFMYGDYEANPLILAAYNVAINGQGFSFISVLTPDQGVGQIKGVIKRLGENYSPVPLCVFKRSNRQLLWETTSKKDGSYAFRNIAKGLECFVVAFDPNNQYNAVIQDKVVAK